MPYRARQEFTQKTGYEFSDNSIIDRISNIGKTENTLEKIEQRTIQSMKTLIAGDAPKHERRRQEAIEERRRREAEEDAANNPDKKGDNKEDKKDDGTDNDDKKDEEREIPF